MIYLLLGFILLLAVYFGCRLFLLRKSMKRAIEDLKDISSNLEENRVLKLSAPDKELEELLKTINQNLQAVRKQYAGYQKKEQVLKEQIENISHDLRTPLTAILGYMKMMDQKEMTKQDQEFLEIAIKKSYTLQELTAQFYELSRVTDKEFGLNLETVDVGRILRETCLDHYRLIEEARLQFEMDFWECRDFDLDLGQDNSSRTVPARGRKERLDSPADIQGNGQALERIFCNLLQNSIRYAESWLKVCLLKSSDAKKVRITFENDISQLTEPEDPSRLFERFYMQERARSRGGTGLGLTISKSLTEHMRGTIKAVCLGEAGARSLAIEMEFPLSE